MIESGNNQVIYQITQNFKIYHITRFRIRIAGYLHFQLIVMAMVMRIGTFSKNFSVGNIIPIRIEQSVGCVEMFLSIYGYLSGLHSVKIDYSPKYSTYIRGVSQSLIQ